MKNPTECKKLQQKIEAGSYTKEGWKQKQIFYHISFACLEICGCVKLYEPRFWKQRFSKLASKCTVPLSGAKLLKNYIQDECM